MLHRQHVFEEINELKAIIKLAIDSNNKDCKDETDLHLNMLLIRIDRLKTFIERNEKI